MKKKKHMLVMRYIQYSEVLFLPKSLVKSNQHITIPLVRHVSRLTFIGKIYMQTEIIPVIFSNIKKQKTKSEKIREITD